MFLVLEISIKEMLWDAKRSVIFGHLGVFQKLIIHPFSKIQEYFFIVVSELKTDRHDGSKFTIFLFFILESFHGLIFNLLHKCLNSSQNSDMIMSLTVHLLELAVTYPQNTVEVKTFGRFTISLVWCYDVPLNCHAGHYLFKKIFIDVRYSQKSWRVKMLVSLLMLQRLGE